MTVKAKKLIFPHSGWRRLIRISIGWILIGIAEALAYTILAVAIMHNWSATPVVVTASIALLLTVLCSRAGYLSGARLAGDLYNALGKALARVKLAWFTAQHRALVTRAAGESIPTFMGVPAHQLQTFILAPLVPVLLIVSIALIGGPAPASLVAMLLVISFIVQYIGQRSLAHADARRHDLSNTAATANLELIEHIELLRTAASPNHVIQRVSNAWQAHEKALRRTNIAAAPATLISAIASVLPLAGMLIFLGTTINNADPGTVLALIVLTGRASAPLDTLALAGLTLADLRNTAGTFLEIIGAPVLPEPTTSTHRNLEDNGFELLNVTSPPALQHITVTLPAGVRTHIAGPTGAGKSTLLSLLMRYDDPVSGQIKLGGIPLTALTEQDLASKIAYVPQDPVVFTGTLASNIRIGRPCATDEEISAAARAAALDDLLERDPLGIHQHVGRYGAALSGGERQRLAIARALIKDAPIVILDEATSALDENTEARIAHAIRELDATVVFVTHRPSDIWQPHHVVELGANEK